MAEIKKISTELQLLDKFLDTSGDAGTSGQVLTSTGTGINWVSAGTPGSGVYLPLAGGTMNNNASVNMNSGQLTSVDFVDFGIGQLNGESTSNLILKSLGDITYNVDSNNNGNSSHIFQESGSELMRIRYDGNVGIGTTSPSLKLEVAGNIGLKSDSAYLRFRNAAAADLGYITNSTTWGDSGSDFSIGASSSNLRFYTNNSSTERMRITSAGNVGIGTTSPQSGFKLDVNGSSVTRGSAYVLTELNHYGTNDFSINASQGLTDIKFIAGGAERIRIKRQGNVGIGTTSPLEKLDVAGTARMDIGITEGIHYIGTSVEHWGDGGTGMQFPANDTISFRTASSDRLYINSTGNVGIGTTSPGQKLDVNGVVQSDRFFVGTNASANQWAVQVRNNASTADSGIYFNNNSSEIYLRNSSNVIGARIRSNSTSYFNGGDVGIGTASPQERLHVSGETHPSIKLSSSSDGNYNVILNCGYRNEALNLSVGGYKVFTTEGFNTPETTHLYSNNSKALSLASNQAATFTSTVTATNFINSSDERLKENIEEVCNNNVEVNWKTFNFKTEKEQKRYGVIAQELEKTNPEFVREDSQGFKSVAYIDLLIAKIAELEARIQKLEK